MRLEYKIFTDTLLITIPREFRNKGWAESFGSLQGELRNLPEEVGIVVLNSSNCVWSDPAPMMSLLIALKELGPNVKKKIYLPNISSSQASHRSFLAFLNKEGFIESFKEAEVEILVASDELGNNRPLSKDDERTLIGFENYLSFDNSTVLPVRIIDLKSSNDISNGIEEFVDQLIDEIRHRMLAITSPTESKELINKISLILKESLENIYEHAYKQNQSKLVGYFIRFRRGLADSSLNTSTRRRLEEIINKEVNNSPRLSRKFIERISGLIEIFVLDAGVGLSSSYYGSNDSRKYKFREAWRETVGMGRRKRSSVKKTKYGGLWTISRICHANYLLARDNNEWIGDELPIKGSRKDYDANRSYQTIASQDDISGLLLLARLSLKSAADDNRRWIHLKESKSFGQKNESINPYVKSLLESRSVYEKYLESRVDIDGSKFRIVDNRFKGYDSDHLDYKQRSKAPETYIFFPEESLSKNSIFNLIQNIARTEINSNCLVIFDIPVWEAALYNYAIEDASFNDTTLKNINRIVLVTRRLSVSVLKRTKKTYKFSKKETLDLIKNESEDFRPANSFHHLIELVKTHDSTIFWLQIRQLNNQDEYFINTKIKWYQNDKEFNLNGYLNFSKTITDPLAKLIFEYVLERTLSLASSKGCKYYSIDILTEQLAAQYNAIFYNSQRPNPTQIGLGSVFLTGLSQKAAELDNPDLSLNYKIHFLVNNSFEDDYSEIEREIPHLILWPSKKKNWIESYLGTTFIEESYGNYRRVGNSYTIAPFGWKFFPIPRYKLYDRVLNDFVINHPNQYDENYEFVSIYKRSPAETYYDWQGSRSPIMSINHVDYESNHDLLNIDFPYSVNESFITGGGIAHFLLGEFLMALDLDQDDIVNTDNRKLIEGTKEYINSEKSLLPNRNETVNPLLIVYPFHYNNDFIVSLIKKYIPPNSHKKIIALFPVNKVRGHSPFLASPLTHQLIRKKIDEFKLKNPDNDSIAITLFDDASVGGRTRSEVRHILKGLGADVVKTVFLVERRRLPIETSDPLLNKAFWRLDIAKLGSSNSCPICAAINNLNVLRRNITSEYIDQRIQSIVHLWKAKNPYQIGEDQIITPTRIETGTNKLMKKFGIYYSDNQHKQCGGDDQRIEITNSFGLSIYVAELFTMTSRDDIVFEFLDSNEINEYVKIELLSTFLLLFNHELSNLVRQRIIRNLFAYCNYLEPNNHTSFALIALLGIETKKLEFLYDFCKDESEGDINVANRDMQILLTFLSLNTTSKFSHSVSLKKLKSTYLDLKDLYKQFHSEIYNDYGVAHDTPLQLIYKEHINFQLLTKSHDSCDKIVFLLDNIPTWYYRSESERISELISNILDIIGDYKGLGLNVEFNSIKINKLKITANQLFKNLESLNSNLFLSLGLRQNKFPLGDRIENLVKNQNEKFAAEDSNRAIGLSRKFGKFIDSSSSQIERWIVWDRYVEREVRFILDNAKSESIISKIRDPFDVEDKKEQKTAWLAIEYEDELNRMNLVIYNQSELSSSQIEDISIKKPRQEKLHLNELGIKLKYEDVKIDSMNVIKTKITFPYV